MWNNLREDVLTEFCERAEQARTQLEAEFNAASADRQAYRREYSSKWQKDKRARLRLKREAARVPLPPEELARLEQERLDRQRELTRERVRRFRARQRDQVLVSEPSIST